VFSGFQVNMYADDVEPGVAFYAALGFEGSYRYAPAGVPLHVELRNGGLTLGIASVRAARDGLDVSQEAPRLSSCSGATTRTRCSRRRSRQEPR